MRRVDVARPNTGPAAVSDVRRDAVVLSGPRTRRAHAGMFAEACTTFVRGAALAPVRAVAVSRDHEIHVELFRSCPELARVLLRTCAGIDVPEGVAELTTIDASQALPIEARCDVVIVFRSTDGTARTAVIVEVQK